MSSDEEDVHQCGRCKESFHSIDDYFVHKREKSCKKICTEDPASVPKDTESLAGGDNLAKDVKLKAPEIIRSSRKRAPNMKRGRPKKSTVPKDQDVIFPIKPDNNSYIETKKLRQRKTVICNSCGYRAANKEELQRHSDKEHKTEILSNDDEEFVEVNVMIKRRGRKAKNPSRYGNGYNPKLVRTEFPCKDCDEVFHRLYLLKRHVSQVHQNEQKEPLKCQWCGEEFERKFLLRNHIRDHHGIAADTSDSCPVCEKALKSHFHVKRHRESLHTPVGAEDCVILQCLEEKKKTESTTENKENVNKETEVLSQNSSDHGKEDHAGDTENKDAKLSEKSGNNIPSQETCFVCHIVCPGRDGFLRHLESHRVWIPDPTKTFNASNTNCEDQTTKNEVPTTIPASELISYAAQQGGVLGSEDQNINQSTENPNTNTAKNNNVDTGDQINQMIQEQTVLTILQEMGQAAQVSTVGETSGDQDTRNNHDKQGWTEYQVMIEPELSQSETNTGAQKDDEIEQNKSTNVDNENVTNLLDADSPNFICPQCCKLFATYKETCEHRRDEHNMIAVFRCVKEACKQIYYEVHEYIEHSNIHPQNSFICRICNDHFEALDLLMTHKSFSHKDVHKTGFYSNGYHCSVCNRPFPTVKKLQHHMENDKHENKCSQCSKVFKSNSELMYHESTHSGVKSYLCDECGGRFVNILALKKHQRIHNPVRNHICEVCGTAFGKREHLKRHLATKHSDDKPFKCTYENCYRAFKRSDKLREHIRVHTGNFIYICDQCGRAYNNKAGLKYHEKTHSRVKVSKYMCQHCDSGFAKQNHLRLHLEMQHGVKKKHIPTHQCKLCNVMFYRVERLNRHTEREHGVQVQWNEICTECGKGFLGKKSLQTHMEERHSTVPKRGRKVRKIEAILMSTEMVSAPENNQNHSTTILDSPVPVHIETALGQPAAPQQQTAIQISAPSSMEYAVQQIVDAQGNILHPGTPIHPGTTVQVATIPTSHGHVYQTQGLPPPQPPGTVTYQYHPSGFMNYQNY